MQLFNNAGVKACLYSGLNHLEFHNLDKRMILILILNPVYIRTAGAEKD